MGHAHASAALGVWPNQFQVFGVGAQRGRPLDAPASVSFYVQLVSYYYGVIKPYRRERAGVPQEAEGAIPRRSLREAVRGGGGPRLKLEKRPRLYLFVNL